MTADTFRYTIERSLSPLAKNYPFYAPAIVGLKAYENASVADHRLVLLRNPNYGGDSLGRRARLEHDNRRLMRPSCRVATRPTSESDP